MIRQIPYCNEIVKPLKDDAMFWDSVWVSCWKPRQGDVHQIMKHTKHKYHYTIRAIKKRNADLRKSGMAESKDIAQVFSEKYQKLYNYKYEWCPSGRYHLPINVYHVHQ